MTPDQLDEMLARITSVHKEMTVPIVAIVQASMHNDYDSPNDMRGNLQVAIGACLELASQLNSLARFIERAIE